MSASRRALVTGSTGFLGAHIRDALLAAGYQVVGLNRHADPVCESQLVDFETGKGLDQVDGHGFELVVHCAGKAHVLPKSEEEGKAFDRINGLGTERLLERLAAHPPARLVYISTIAVYGREEGSNITESLDPQPSTPYGRSKLAGERAVTAFAKTHQIPALLLRLPLVAGAVPPGNLGDLANRIASGTYFSIRGNEARKSVVLAEDVADLIVTWTGTNPGVYNLTDGADPRFTELERAIELALGKTPSRQLPLGLLRFAASCGDLAAKLGLPSPLTSSRLDKLLSTLTFSSAAARKALPWQPRPTTTVLPTLPMLRGQAAPL